MQRNWWDGAEKVQNGRTLPLWIPGGVSGDNRHRAAGSLAKLHFSPGQPRAQAFAILAPCLSSRMDGGKTLRERCR